MDMNRFTQLLFMLCLLAFLPAAQAEDAPWYQVEILVFANDDPDALDDEFWPANLTVPEKPNAIELGSRSEGQQRPFTRLPRESLLFTSERRRIEQYDGFRVLFHGGWMQPVTSKRFAKPVHIRAGQVLDNGQYELDGYITIDKGRYLHFRPNLFHSRQLSTQEQNILQSFEQQEETATSQETSLIPELELPDFLTVQMDQGRRMRSKEVHYLDHPLMGILVLMLPMKKATTPN